MSFNIAFVYLTVGALCLGTEHLAKAVWRTFGFQLRAILRGGGTFRS